VVVITDLFENIGAHEDLLKSLRHLRHRGHEVIVFHVLEGQTERRFSFPDRPMLFRDVETGDEVTIQPSQLREHYADAVDHFTDHFRRSCLEHDIDFAELDTNAPYDEALMAYLNKRGRLV
jgi:predicted nicotinamide N-methyase